MIVTDGVGSRQLRQHLARPKAAEGVVLGPLGNSVESKLQNLLIQAANRHPSRRDADGGTPLSTFR
jgi:hypothetical protein